MPPCDILVQEIPWIEPALAVTAWADEPYLAWLDSGGGPGRLNRYSYIAAEPFALAAGLAALEAGLAKWRLPPQAGPVPFGGGAIGFIGYGMARRLHHLPDRHVMPHPAMTMGFYDVLLAFDRQEQRCFLLSSGFPEQGAARGRRAQRRAEATLARLQTCRARSAAVPELRWTPELSQAAYEDRVRRILEYIRAGDIYQANFTTRFTAERPPDLTAFDIHTALRAANPAPFAAFINCGDFALASASPERFISLDASGAIETRPIKGTRPRGAGQAADDRLREELWNSEKDRAENLMIVDLMRSDLGRVAVTGSVAVPALWQVESHASVHHLVSVITAQLRPLLGPVDVLRACLPGGSITGAPKRRAMEIIDEQEASPRGAYCGIIGWIGFDGAMDTSIIIRTISMTGGALMAQAGGGIVADSDPAAEYEEMMVKLRPLLRPFGGWT